jgi:hypothetical protein
MRTGVDLEIGYAQHAQEMMKMMIQLIESSSSNDSIHTTRKSQMTRLRVPVKCLVAFVPAPELNSCSSKFEWC